MSIDDNEVANLDTFDEVLERKIFGVFFGEEARADNRNNLVFS